MAAVNLRDEFIKFKDSINRANVELKKRIDSSAPLFDEFGNPTELPMYLEQVDQMLSWLRRVCLQKTLPPARGDGNGVDPPPDPPGDPDPPSGG